MIDGDISFFYSDPKLKDVTFEYLVNGEKLSTRQLTSTSINQVFGSSEFSVAGNYSKTEEINEVQVIIKTQDKIQSTISVKPCGPIPTETQRCIPKVPTDTKPISTDMFMKRLWAFKRINYLLTGAKECLKLVAAYNIGNNDSCIQEALGLALEYNFVTDLTSLVIEENDDYIKEGPVKVNKNPKFVSLAGDQGFVPISPITAQALPPDDVGGIQVRSGTDKGSSVTSVTGCSHCCRGRYSNHFKGLTLPSYTMFYD